MFDFHMHSNFSADGEYDMREMVLSAIDKGLETICFTDHLDIDYPDKEWDFTFSIEKYSTMIAQVQQEFENKIRIYRGVEVGVQPHVLKASADFVSSLQPDFAICSMHATGGLDLHSGHFFEGKSVEVAYRQYYEELYECLQDFSTYQVLGHIDLIKRYDSRVSADECYDVIEAILKRVISQGKGIELNTSGFKYGLGTGMPSKDILRLYRELGGEIVTIGSDAHRPNEIGAQFQKSLEMLQSIGFTYIASFENQEPCFTSIDKVKTFL